MKSYILLLLTCGSVLFAQPARDRLVENNSRSPVNGVQLADSSTAWNPSDEPSAERKDVTAAVVYSLLLPGMGELYAGNYGIGKYFTIVEGALWVTLIGFDRYANWIQNDAREFATEHAGISIAGKDNQYFVEIGNYINVQAYNAQALRDRDPLSLYNEQSSYAWSWDSPANLQLYSNMRINSDQWFDNTHFVVAAIVVNHLVSAINAARLAILYNKNLDQSGLIDIRARVIGGLRHPDGVMITFSKSF